MNTNSGSTSLDKYERFEAWLRENGAHFDMVRSVSADCIAL